MEFNCNVSVVDAICGAGKTESIINMINATGKETKFIVVTPFLDEITRYRTRCKERNFKEPLFGPGRTKKENLKELLSRGENIVTTHAMFQKFDNEIIDMCRAVNYTLIMDEVANVVEEKAISKDDYKTLLEYTEIDPETKQMRWKEEFASYNGKFDDEKRLCDLGSLVCYGDNLMIWLFPITAFNAFRNIYILTYMFDCQLQKYYYDYYGLPYNYLSVKGSYGNHHLVEYDPNISYIKYDYQKLIHIVENEKMNRIGDRQFDLSKTWYVRNSKNIAMKTLKNNILNFFCNIRNNSSFDNIWTTFKDYQNCLKGKGYTKGFLPLNARATNEYRDRTSVAYPINRYINTFVKNFFVFNGIDVDEDNYALSEMLQFIWRSAIRDGKEIWVYIPSIRMRNLLYKWIEENTIKN